MSNVIESYLVSLGFRVENNELKKFDLALKQAGDIATHHSTGIAQQFLKWQTAIVGGFAAIGLATIGMMDKVADADLGYQQLARQMGTTKNVARDYDIVLKALGVSLADATWNPEVRARVRQGVADAKLLRSELGIGGKGDSHDDALKSIRDTAFQFDRLKIAAQFIAIDVVSKIAQAFGGKQNTLKDWVDWVIKNAPKISDWVTHTLVPILKDAWHVMQDVWRVAVAIGDAFIRIVGAISGDDGMAKGTLGFDSFGKAIDKVSGYLVRFVDAVTSAIIFVTDLVRALTDLSHGHFGDAIRDVVKGFREDLTGGGEAVGITALLGALFGVGTIGGLAGLALGIGKSFVGGIVKGAITEALAARGITGAVGAATEGVTGAAAAGEAATGGAAVAGGAAAATGSLGLLPGLGIAAGLDWVSRHFKIDEKVAALDQKYDPKFAAWVNHYLFGAKQVEGTTPGATPTVPRSGDLISSVASKYGISADLARAVAWAESRNRQTDASGHVITSKAGAMGMFQLMRDTAAGYGVDAKTLGGNVEGGMHLLSDLMAKYGGNVREVLAAYNWGSGHLDRAIKKHGGFDMSYLPRETRDYIRSIEGRLGGGADSQVAVTVNVSHMNATPDQVAAAVKKGIREAQGKLSQTNYLNARPVHA